MAGIVAWAYRDIVFTKPLPTQFRYTMQILILMNSIVYALLVAAVIINFPSGTIVGLIYLVGYGLGIIGRYIITASYTYFISY